MLYKKPITPVELLMNSVFYANQPPPDVNARQAAMTIRQPSTALLTIDSEDRYQNYETSRAAPTSPYNFSIVKRESLMPGFITRIGVSEITFPWCIPNINVKTAQIQFEYQIGAAPPVLSTFQLPYGFYTPNSLATAIQVYIRANTPIVTFTMTYGGLVYPNNLGQTYFSYASGTVGTTVAFLPLPYTTAAYPYPKETKQLFDLLGLTGNNAILQVAATGGYTLCQAIRYVDIVCTQLTNSQAQKDQTSQHIARDMLCRMYLGNGSGDGQSTVEPTNAAFCPPGCAPMILYRNFTMPKQIQWIPNQNIPGFLQFQVFDDSGDLLDNSVSVATPYGPAQRLDWSMSMLVSEC